MEKICHFLNQSLPYLCFSFILLGFVIISNAFKKPRFDLDDGDGKIYLAWHTRLPGFEKTHLSEDEVNLRDHSNGIHVKGLADSKIAGISNPEIRAGKVLQKYFGYDGYLLLKKGNNYVLYRAEKRKWKFTWHAEYQIGPWRKLRQ
jgi:hypothetical protein